MSLALHGDGDGPTSVRDIAERTGLPQPYLEQILLALKGAGLVRSKRGVGGGYVLAREPSSITLGAIVSAVDGPIVLGDFGEPHQNGACDHEGQCVLLVGVGRRQRADASPARRVDAVRRRLYGSRRAGRGRRLTDREPFERASEVRRAAASRARSVRPSIGMVEAEVCRVQEEAAQVASGLRRPP